MAYLTNKTPKDLTPLTSLDDDDVVIVGDDTIEAAKHITWANLKTAIQTFVEGFTSYFNVTTGDSDDITQGSSNLFLTTAERSAISANTAKTGVTTEISNVSEDTSPQAGGEFDFQANSAGFTMQTATGDGSTTIDWGSGNHFDFTFGAFNETFTFTDPAKSGVYTLTLTQDSTGSRTATWPASVKWAGGSAPTLTTTATTGYDIISFRFDGTNYYAVSSLDFS